MVLFYSFHPTVAKAKDLALMGFGSICKVGRDFVERQESERDAIVFLSSNKNIIHSEAKALSWLLPFGRKFHLLATDPLQGPTFTSRGVLVTPSHIKGFKNQILTLTAGYNGSPEHINILDLLSQGLVLGVCSPDEASWAEAYYNRMSTPIRGPDQTGFSLITFDLDGVLVESKELHFDAFNLALKDLSPSLEMTKEEHDQNYCGLSTKQKLRKLTVEKGLPPEKHDYIWAQKQRHTLELMKTSIKPDTRIRSVIQQLRDAGYPVAVASNCIKDSVFYLLRGIGVEDLVSFYFSNEDVSFAKPHPEIYLAVADHFGLSPDEMLVIEDSGHGKQAAILAGAQLCPVASPNDVNIDYISSTLARKHSSRSRLNIIIPMAGNESLFIDSTSTPKFLLDINGQSLLERMVTNLQPSRPHRFIFIARKYQARTYGLAELCVRACNFQPMVLREVERRSSSAIETFLAAKDLIGVDQPVLLANLNMWPILTSTINVDTLADISADCILTHFESTQENLSYVKVNNFYSVDDISTKLRSSCHATTGYTFFKRGYKFFQLCESLQSGKALFIEDVIKRGLEDRMDVMSFPVDCVTIRESCDLDKLRDIIKETN